MPKVLDVCEEYFGTRDIYELFEVPKDALPKDVKKAYYKLSLKVHPDRVSEEEKERATEKFKILSKLHQVLSDKDKRALYDEQGIIEDDDDDYESKLTNWLELWKKIFKPLTTEDIDNYQREYVGSELERNDIKKAYLSGRGCINSMFNDVPFIQVKDEPRLQKIVRELIDAGEVPEYKIFTQEPAQKRNRRHKKYERESKEAAEIKKKLQAKSDISLEQQIMKRSQERASNFDSLLDKLMEKYGGEDDGDVIDFGKLEKKQKKKKGTPSKRDKLHTVRNGRVKKHEQD